MRRKLTEFGRLVDQKFHFWYQTAAALLGVYFLAVTIFRWTTPRPEAFAPGLWVAEAVTMTCVCLTIHVLGYRRFQPRVSTNAIGGLLGLAAILNAAWVQALANYPAMTVNWIFLIVTAALLTKSWWHWLALEVLSTGLWTLFALHFKSSYMPLQHWIWSMISALLVGLLTNLCLTWVFREAEQLWVQTHVLARQRAILLKGLREQAKTMKTISGLIPICAHCKKIRNDQGYWYQVEAFLQKNTDVKLTHGICPDCAKEWKKQR